MTFSSGNYNDFEKLVRVRIPSTSDTIRNTIIPKIEDTLKQMLRTLNGVNGKALNAEVEVGNKELQGISCKIEYEVQDFNVPEAPKEAIKEDVDNIKKSIEIEGLGLRSITINTSNGLLSIEYFIPVED
jgi:hypothetical protein